MNESPSTPTMNDTDIAVIGMACRFPGAAHIHAFWENLEQGVSSISFFSDDEVKAAGVDETLLEKPGYVKAGAILTDIELFSADFFDISPKKAEITDPQHRVFLECAWEALESSGYANKTEENVIGVYAGAALNAYLLNNVYPNRTLLNADGYSLMIGNEKDYLPTRVSYKLNLKGPSVNVQSACSTSLAAVHLACQGLLDGECNIALAGGAAIHVPQKIGYLYKEGLIQPPDGHTRTFDGRSKGTVFGDGAGVVVLKRLKEAAADNDCIHAVIKGSAANNDGSAKIGYTAPALEGQARVISEAHAIAGIKAETITYIEAHGTGTLLGDPIEIEALTRAFRAGTQKKRFCALGSIKSNIGHPDIAAGAAGFIKTVLALKYKMLPPSLHFEQPNPKIDFENSPFYVNTGLTPWQTNGIPCRAGVSSFGMGGTNVHVVLEEAPAREASGASRTWQLLVLSAKSPSALDRATANLAGYLERHPGINLADAAYTLGESREGFGYRRALICRDIKEAAAGLRSPGSVLTGSGEAKTCPVVFMFSGQGAQYVNMGLELYQAETVFREQIHRCSEHLEPILGLDMRQVLYPGEDRDAEAGKQLNQTAITQPALFVIEYALAKLWMSWGVYPEAMIGHSIGEYVAACLAGVFSLKDALLLVAERGRLMQQMPKGSMLSVSLPESGIKSFLVGELSLAAVNAPDSCVVSGPTPTIDLLEKQLKEQDVQCRRIHTSHAFHSRMMEPILEPFIHRVKQIRFNPPQIPYLSNFTGTWITPGDLADPAYWAKHLRHMVRFAEGLGRLSSDPAPILLEVGPGRTLSTFARKQPGKASEQPVLSSMRHPRDREPDVRFLLNTLARLWLSGAQVDWKGFYAHEHRHRLDLPTYPLEQKRYWIDPPKPGTITPQESQTLSDKRLDIDDWFYLPLWKETILPVSPAKINLESCLVFEDECGVGSLLAEKLKHQCREIITVKPGESFARSGENQYTLSPRQSDDYEALIKELRTRGMPQMIIHLWSVTQGMASPTYYCCGNTQMPGEKFGNENKVLQYSNTGENRRTFEDIDRAQDLGFYSLFFLARALGKQDVTDEIRIAAVSNNMHAIAEEEELYPEKATILGPIKVIGKEFPNIRCQSIDIVIPPPVKGRTERLINQLAVEIITASPDPVIALRGVHRWVQRFESTRLRHTGTPKLREKGVYLITGGLGGIGLTLARHLAETVQARLILTGRSALPPKEEWQAWQAAHGEHDAVSHKIKTVQELESRGAEVLIAGVDAADYRQVQETIAAARQRFGEINGVIHAAGVPDGALVLRQTPGMLNAVLAPKMKGALVLDSLITDLEPDFFILCSSLMSITGFVGQTGYCAANAFLDAFALFKRTTGEPFIAVNWDGWQELGMLAAPGPSSIPGEIRNASHPLFERCIMESTGEMRFISHLNVNRHWFLDEHRIAGKAVLPGTAQLELASAALETHLRSHTIEIRDVYFLHPLVVEDNEDKEVHTLLKKQGNGFEFTINSQSGPGAWQEHARGLISSIHKEPAKKHDIDTIKRRCRQREVIIEQGFTEKSPDQLNGAELFMKNHGLHWHSLKQANLGTREGFARLELPGDLTGDLTKYQLHPALLDTATAFLYLLDSSQGDYPFYCKRVVVKAPLPAKFFSFARYAGTWGAQAGMFPFDITLMDEQGGELVEIEEYTLRQVETGSFAHKPAAPAANDRNDQGILSAEGLEVFDRIFGCPLPQVIVSTKNLEYRIQQVSNFMKEERKGDKPGDLPGQLHSRPQLPYAYTAPRTELEQQLARVWQTSLGIEKVGIHDDFFDLGGDSLLAFQVIARIRDTLQIELPGHSILNTPTIARLIKQNLQQFKQAAPPELPPGLVKIQAGQPGKPPLFLIHPIGGYVYIYRDLAHRLGPGQPVYGIQPRGLEGEAKPLTTVEEMAAHYIELVRSRQPQGPYYIGGSSFGGMVAFEMAHQLRGAGQHAALLAMIDTPGTRRQADKFKTDEDILKYLLDVGDNISIPPDRLARMEPMEKVRFLLEERRKTNGPGLGDLDPNNIRRSFNLFKITQMAIWNYKPRVYPGPVIFFSAMEADAYNVLNPETAWIDLVRGGLEVIRVPGNHKTMNYEPHVQVIADRLKNGMEHAAP